MIDNTYYVDNVGYEVNYLKGSREMTTALTGEIYHYFNGFLHLVVF